MGFLVLEDAKFFVLLNDSSWEIPQSYEMEKKEDGRREEAGTGKRGVYRWWAWSGLVQRGL